MPANVLVLVALLTARRVRAGAGGGRAEGGEALEATKKGAGCEAGEKRSREVMSSVSATASSSSLRTEPVIRRIHIGDVEATAKSLQSEPARPGPPATGPGVSYNHLRTCLLYTSPSPRDKRQSRMPSSA